jgi:hypothetical protein
MSSSGQYSGKSLPSGKKRCSQCGEVVSSTAEMCLLCREMFSVQSGALPPNACSASAWREQNAMVFLGALSILACGALTFVRPLFLLVLVTLAALAVLRTAALSRGYTAPRSNLVHIGNFLGSLGAASLFGLAAVPVFLCVLMVLSAHDIVRRDWIMSVSVGAGLFPGFVIIVLLLCRLFWLKKG